MKRPYTRVFVGSDSHCGHRVGLTPPQYQSRSGFGKWEQVQAELWQFYIEKLDQWKPFDIALLNGDLIDGKGQKSGGSELTTADRLKQAEIAYTAFREIGAKKYRFTYGTPYHAGTDEDFEQKIVDEFIKSGVDADINGHGFYEINGRNIDMKHKIANGMHHTRATPMLKEIDANMFWFMAEVEPLADVVIRSHVHKSLGTYQDGKFGFITPALMGLGDKYGSRQCGNVTVEFGFLVLDIPNDKEKSLTWKFETMKGVINKNQCEVL